MEQEPAHPGKKVLLGETGGSAGLQSDVHQPVQRGSHLGRQSINVGHQEVHLGTYGGMRVGQGRVRVRVREGRMRVGQGRDGVW